jgi:carboxyl-terminal processing protease
VALLTDTSTAGTCEVLAAALHDSLGAPLLGQRSWGRGSVYRLLPLQHGDGVLLAVGRYLSPSGKEWNGKGLQPDLAIEKEASASGDPQRRKAIDYLRGMTIPEARQAA